MAVSKPTKLRSGPSNGGSPLSTSLADPSTELRIDLDKPVVCEAVWHDGSESYPCDNVAEYTGIGHNEIEGHLNSQLVICSECAELLLTHPNAWCKECEVPLLTNVHPL